MSGPVIELATIQDLPQLTNLLMDLFSHESDFLPDHNRQMHGLRLILEQPNRGRIFVARHGERILGMINLLLTISTAEGGFVLLLEDLIVHQDFRNQGVGALLLQHGIAYAKEKNFLRITLLTDRVTEESEQRFFRRHGFKDSNMIPMRLKLDTSKP